MLGLLVAVAVAQAGTAQPTVALFERPAPGGPPRARVEALEEALRVELEKAGVPVALLPADVKTRLQGTKVEGCLKGLECLFRVGEVLRADAVVSIESSQLEDDVAVSLDAVSPAGQRRLARRSFVVKTAEIPGALSAELAPFAAEVARELRSTDVPLAERQARLAPDHLPPGGGQAPGGIGMSPSPWRRAPAIAATTGAALTAGAAVGFFASALTHDRRARTVDAAGLSPLTHAQAERRAELANRNASFALASAGVSAALTATAIWLWTR